MKRGDTDRRVLPRVFFGAAVTLASVGVGTRVWAETFFPLDAESQVNTYTTSTQSSPSVARDGTGNFVVVWHSNGSIGTDSAGYSIQARRYDSTGAALGGQFQVNTYTTGGQGGPRVACDGAGNFVVAWQSVGSAGTDTDSGSI